MRTSSKVVSKDGTKWYYEQEGSGPDVILIPDGGGDCTMFDKSMSLIAGQGFRVTSFDMPGMSRSNETSPETYREVTAQKLAQSVIGVLDALSIPIATFWGSSSGAATVLALATGYPDRLSKIEDDEELSAQVEKGFLTMIGNDDAWYGLGKPFQARMWKNYVVWARGYPVTLPPSIPITSSDITKRPLHWTIGAATPTAIFFDNIVIATKNGIPVSTLEGMHLPYVSHPEAFAQYVVEVTRRFA